MARPVINRRILLPGNRRFGSLLYFVDAQGRGCLKITCKVPIGSATLWRKNAGSDEREMLEEEPPQLTLDISYKYADSLLEIKREYGAEKPKRTFSNFPLPPKGYLFQLKIKNWHKLPIADPQEGDILLEAPAEGEQLAIFFSLPGEDGKGFVDPEYLDTAGLMVRVEIPEAAPRDVIFIGTTVDELQPQEEDLTYRVIEFK